MLDSALALPLLSYEAALLEEAWADLEDSPPGIWERVVTEDWEVNSVISENEVTEFEGSELRRSSSMILRS